MRGFVYLVTGISCPAYLDEIEEISNLGWLRVLMYLNLTYPKGLNSGLRGPIEVRKSDIVLCFTSELIDGMERKGSNIPVSFGELNERKALATN